MKRVLAALALMAANPAWAGPPFVTDDPEPVENQHWEINTALTTSHSQNARTLGAPSVDINYGLMPDVQIHAQPTLTYQKADGHKHYGLDDTEVGVKYRFFNHEGEDAAWLAAIYPMLLLPTADKTINPDKRRVDAFLPLWLQRSSKEWTIYGGGGYRINTHAPDSRNSYFLGITALRHISEHLHLGGELFHETPVSAGDKSTEGFNLGGIYDFSDRYHVLFSAGKGLINTTATNQFSSYLGLQLSY